MSINILGIDVSKKKLDVVLLSENNSKAKSFDNSPKGFRLIAGWLQSQRSVETHVCLEATGSYGDGVAQFLHEAGFFVSVVNPLRIKGFASSKLQRNKTDTADAALIAEFCRTQRPDQWFPPSPQVAELQALTRRIEVLKEMVQAEENRLETAPQKTKPSIRRIIRTLTKEIESLESDIKVHIDKNPDLKKQDELLRSIPGIGKQTSHVLLAEIEFSRFRSAREVAAFAGVTPRKSESGTSLKFTSLSKLGSSRIRKAIYFPAISAIRYNPLIKEFAGRLAGNGKPPMQIICASMRKLLHIAFGVLKTRSPFNSELA